MNEHFFTERGIYYRTNDFRPERTTLLLIHGLSGSSSAWARYEPVWEREYNVITPDLRGHGKSLKPGRYEEYELETLVEDLELLLAKLGVNSYVVLSQSFAVLPAVLLIRRHPEKVRAAIFMSTVYGIYSIFLTRISRLIVHVAASVCRLFSYSNAAGRHIDYSKFPRAGDWNMRRIFQDIPNTTWHAWLFCLDHGYARDLDPLWRDIKVPSLIMHGRHDQISPLVSALRLAKNMSNARLVILENTSHVFPIVKPDEAREIITNYLRETLG